MCRSNVQRRPACGNHSGLIVKTIPGCCENRSPSRRNHLSPSARNPVHLRPGTFFTFTPESRSPCPGIRRLARFRRSLFSGVCQRRHRAEQVYLYGKARQSVGRAKSVKEIGFSAICGERKQTPRFDVSRWNYDVARESMGGHLLLGVQEVPGSNPGGPTSGCFVRTGHIGNRLFLRHR